MESGMKCNASDMWSPKMPEGLSLEISDHPKKMKRVVNLILAIERLKGGKTETLCGTEFRDENLLSIMLDQLDEEQIVFECYATPSLFIRRKEHQCSITDSQKRSLVLVENSMELHAVVLQGGNGDHKVHLNMATYVNPSPSTEARPVALGIKDCTTDRGYYLSCHKDDGDEPSLHLEAVEDKSILSSISSDSELVRFLFYKQDSGKNVSTLVSALYPDWYISTAQEDNQLVEMCMESEGCYKNFTIKEENHVCNVNVA